MQPFHTFGATWSKNYRRVAISRYVNIKICKHSNVLAPPSAQNCGGVAVSRKMLFKICKHSNTLAPPASKNYGRITARWWHSAAAPGAVPSAARVGSVDFFCPCAMILSTRNTPPRPPPGAPLCNPFTFCSHVGPCSHLDFSECG